MCNLKYNDQNILKKCKVYCCGSCDNQFCCSIENFRLDPFSCFKDDFYDKEKYLYEIYSISNSNFRLSL